MGANRNVPHTTALLMKVQYVISVQYKGLTSRLYTNFILSNSAPVQFFYSNLGVLFLQLDEEAKAFRGP